MYKIHWSVDRACKRRLQTGRDVNAFHSNFEGLKELFRTVRARISENRTVILRCRITKLRSISLPCPELCLWHLFSVFCCKEWALHADHPATLVYDSYERLYYSWRLLQLLFDALTNPRRCNIMFALSQIVAIQIWKYINMYSVQDTSLVYNWGNKPFDDNVKTHSLLQTHV